MSEIQEAVGKAVHGGSVLVDPARAGSPQSPGTYTWGGVWGHVWWVDPARRLTAILMTNTAVEGLHGQLAEDVLAAVYASV